MIRKIITILIMTALLLAPYGGIAVATQENWQYFKELPVDSQGFALISLDTEVMQNCLESFADIRVTDGQGREIASQLIQPGREEVVQSVSILNAINYEQYTSVMIDMGANPRPHNKLDLKIAMDKTEDYLREVEILASNDASNWRQLGSGKIFAYQKEQFNQISYPTSTMRYLQVNIKKKPGESDLRVTSAQLKFLSSNVYAGNLLAAPIISNRSDKTTTKIVIDLGVPNFMITDLQIQTSDGNFNRAINIGSSDQDSITGQESQRVYDRIIAYDWNNYLLNKDRVTVDQFCRRYLIISILNEDSPPLDIQAIHVYGAAPAFLADLAAPSILWYCNPLAGMPSYDLKQFASLITKSDLKAVKAGGQQINPDYKAPVVPWTERNKWLLDAAIVLAAGGFVLIIQRKFKQLSSRKDV
ncbi:MAG: hypothetical protein CVU90_05875 [Firmicutes bacterium HGW-Firmicutes-15]|nr:MAG: hypothetical protein CVU90_05875 [Firmicutes bacterium HGW-Firmicutes-15]